MVETKKKSFLDFLLPLIGLIIAIVLSLHIAISYENVQKDSTTYEYMNDNGKQVVKIKFNYGAFFTDLNVRLNEKLFEFKKVDCTFKVLSYGIGTYLFLLLYLRLSRKKLITGKEYGSAEPGTAKAIKHLQASSIRKRMYLDVLFKWIKKSIKNWIRGITR